MAVKPRIELQKWLVFYVFPMNWRKKFALRGSSLFSTEVVLRLPTTNDNQSHPQSLFDYLNWP